MVSISLEEVIKKAIENISNGKVDERVVSFTDYKNKYAILKSKVNVKIELSKGIEATIDVSDYFKEELK